MMQLRSGILRALAAGALLALGCGTPAPPMPPSLDLPRPVDDLQAERRSDKVFLDWTVPSVTTDRAGVRRLGKAIVCRGLDVRGACNSVVAEIPLAPQHAGKKLQAVDDISAVLQDPQGRDFLPYVVFISNSRGRFAGPSNAAVIFLGPTAPQPRQAAADIESESIQVTWTVPELPVTDLLRMRYIYRVLRLTAGEEGPVRAHDLPAEVGPMRYRDQEFAWGKTYYYQVVGVSQVYSRDGRFLSEYEGEASPVLTLHAKDIYPPAPPQAVQAVYTELQGGFIDLSWSPSAAADLAGYAVYRQGPQEETKRLNSELLRAPAFRDPQVRRGVRYEYFVTAVDLRGNESAPSAPAVEEVPQ